MGEPFRDYLSDLDRPFRPGRERYDVTVHCPMCGREDEVLMPVDWDLIGEELPDCPSCGMMYEEGTLEGCDE